MVILIIKERPQHSHLPFENNASTCHQVQTQLHEKEHRRYSIEAQSETIQFGKVCILFVDSVMNPPGLFYKFLFLSRSGQVVTFPALPSIERFLTSRVYRVFVIIFEVGGCGINTLPTSCERGFSKHVIG